MFYDLKHDLVFARVTQFTKCIHTKKKFTRFERGEGAVTEVVASRTQRSADILKIGIVAAKDSFEYPRAARPCEAGKRSIDAGFSTRKFHVAMIVFWSFVDFNSICEFNNI